MRVEELNIKLVEGCDSVKYAYKLNNGYWHEYTRGDFGKVLTYKDSMGAWYEYTRDELGNPLTYKDSEGKRKEF